MTKAKLLRKLAIALRGEQDLRRQMMRRRSSALDALIGALDSLQTECEDEEAPTCRCGRCMALDDDPGFIDEWRCTECRATTDDDKLPRAPR
jgi:hypothetical protein